MIKSQGKDIIAYDDNGTIYQTFTRIKGIPYEVYEAKGRFNAESVERPGVDTWIVTDAKRKAIEGGGK